MSELIQEIAMLDTSEMARLTKDLPTKSEKMRTLAKAGFSRSDIARFLGTRYQFVRNVLEHEKVRQAAALHATDNPADDDLAGAGEGRPVKVRVGPNGQVNLPAAFRDELGFKEGSSLVAVLEDGGIRLLPMAAAVRRAQAMVRKFIPEGVSLVDALIEDRREEAEREQRGG
jgi:AbrB family looped-hinge helix DNA binding protein